MNHRFFTLLGMIGVLFSLCLAGLPSTGLAAGWQPELRVGLFFGQSGAELQVNVPAVLQESDTEKRMVFFSPGKTMKIAVQSGKLTVDGKRTDAAKLSLRPQQKASLNTMQVTVNGKTYYGGIQILLRNGGMTIINLVNTEDYLRGVVPREMPPEWPAEALKAQAVAARTFALKHRKRHESEGYDLCASTHCQLYDGTASESESADAAIRATSGMVLMYGKELINANFHTDSGGMTESSQAVWGNHAPYLQPVKESATKTLPWKQSFSLENFSKQLAKAGYPVGTVKNVKLSKLTIGKGASDRSASGRVKTMRVIGTKGSKTIEGNELRSMLALKSTLFDVQLQGNQIHFIGYGFGHGVGMSQYGAKTLAGSWSYDKILSHFYKGVTLKKLY